MANAKELNKVLIITDSFPPEVVGGAELSLHNLLTRMNTDAEICVAALSSQTDIVKYEHYDRFGVYRIPFQENWPAYTSSPTRSIRYMGFVRDLLSQGKSTPQYLKAVGTNVQLHKQFPQSLGIYPLADRFYLLNSKCIDHLQEIVSKEAPQVIHADNYRSIMLAAEIQGDIPTVSLVRDNRFFCAHRNQATNIAGSVCSTCSYGCTVGKASPRLEKAVRELMDDTMTLRRKALLSSHCVAVTSQYLCTQVSAVVGQHRVAVVPNITEDPDLISKWVGDATRDEAPRILCVGMIGHNKGQRQLLQIFKQLTEKDDKCRLIFAGRGALTESLQLDAINYGLAERVEFPGFLSRAELMREYARATVIACPNVWPEPFGRVPLEAGIVGRPVVAFDVGGMSENIVEGETGFLVTPEKTDEFANRLSLLLRDSNRAEKMGARARELMTERHYEACPEKKLLDIWQSLISTS